MWFVEERSYLKDMICVFKTKAEAVIYAKALAWQYWWGNSQYEPCELYCEKELNLWEVYLPIDEEEAEEGVCGNLFAEIFFWYKKGDLTPKAMESNFYNLKGNRRGKWMVRKKENTIDLTKYFPNKYEAELYARYLAYEYWEKGQALFEFDEDELRWNILSCDEKENPIDNLATIWIEGE